MKVSLLLFLVFCAASCFASTNCQSNFQVGQLAFCVTENGNIGMFYDGTISDGAEGYGICAPTGTYYDLGLYGDSGNWDAATITQPHGPNKFPLTITRQTSDHVFTVTQQFSFAGAGSSVKVKMTVMASPTSPDGITFFRYSDPSVFPSGNSQYGDQTSGTAFVWNRGGKGFAANMGPAGGAGQQALLIQGGNPNVCNWLAPNILPYAGDAATLLQWKWPGGKLKADFNYAPLR